MIGNAKLAEDLVVRRREDVEAGKQPTVKHRSNDFRRDRNFTVNSAAQITVAMNGGRPCLQQMSAA